MLEISVDKSVPSGTGLLLGPFKVERTDYGLMAVNGGPRRVYQERVHVKAFDKEYTAWVEVDEETAQASRDVGRVRAQKLHKTLQVMGEQIEKDLLGKK